ETYRRAVAMEMETQTAIDIYRKLAQCYLQLKRDADAQWAVNNNMHYLKKLETEGKKPKAEIKPAAPTAYKLIVSAPKKALELVGSGKMSLAEFQKAAGVEMIYHPVQKK